MKRYVWSLLLGALLFVPATPADAAGAPKIHVFGGYVYVRDLDLDGSFPLGFAVGVGGTVTDWLSIVGEVSGSTRQFDTEASDLRLNLLSWLVGPQFSKRTNTIVTPFFQVLLGRARVSGSVFGENLSSTQFAVQPGAGLDVAVRPRLGIRVEGDYRVISENLRTLAGGERSKELRVFLGVVFSPGR